jgi:Domain of unknown function (DUF4783)
MKTFFLPVLFILFILPAAPGADPIDKVADLIRKGNIQGLSKLFAADVEITFPENENIYSKAQATMILDRFFSQNKPRAVRMLHKVNSNPNYSFGVLIVDTDNGPYRIAYTLKESDGQSMIIDFRIEVEKGR